MYQDMINAFNDRIKRHSEELMAKGIFPQDFDITSQKDKDKIIKYENNIAYRIYRNIITIPRQGIVQGGGIFLLLEIFVLSGAFIVEIYPSELWLIVKTASNIAGYLCLGVVLSFIFLILNVTNAFNRFFKWFDKLTDSFIDDGIPVILNIFEWSIFWWTIRIFLEALL